MASQEQRRASACGDQTTLADAVRVLSSHTINGCTPIPLAGDAVSVFGKQALALASLINMSMIDQAEAAGKAWSAGPMNPLIVGECAAALQTLITLMMAFNEARS